MGMRASLLTILLATTTLSKVHVTAGKRSLPSYSPDLSKLPTTEYEKLPPNISPSVPSAQISSPDRQHFGRSIEDHDASNQTKDQRVSDVQRFQLLALNTAQHNILVLGTAEPKLFYQQPCGMDRHCYSLLTNGLQCRNETCQCIVWQGIQLQWKEDRALQSGMKGVCLSAEGHPCITDKMCYSEKCNERTRKCSGGASIRIGYNKLSSILIDLAVYVLLPVNVIALRLY